jgi:hypothetical protein
VPQDLNLVFQKSYLAGRLWGCPWAVINVAVIEVRQIEA